MSVLKIVWGGRIVDNVSGAAGAFLDEWSCSLSAVPDVAGDPEDWLAGVAAAIATFHQSTGANISARALLEYVKVNEFEEGTFHQITDPTVVHDYGTAFKRGNVQTNPVPTFLSQRVSLDNGTRNPRARGGFYVPVYQAEPQQNGRYSASNQGLLLGVSSTLITAINTALSPGYVCIWSHAGNTTYEVSRVRVGNVPDYISRRKNKLREEYEQTTI